MIAVATGGAAMVVRAGLTGPAQRGPAPAGGQGKGVSR